MIELDVAGSDRPALVDDCWAHLARYRWRLDRDGYVMRKARGYVYLHHVVLPEKRFPEFVRDHESRDKLDNRSSNLRWLTQAQSVQNRGPCRKNTTGVRGVRFDARKGQYLAVVQHRGKAVARGWFDALRDAEAFLAGVRPTILPFAA